MSRAFVLVLKMAALISVLLFGLTIVLACSFVESVYPVPVFLWSKESHLNGAFPVLAGHTIKEQDFQELYLNKLFRLPQTICIFLQDKLSIDDISLYGDAYSPGSHGAAFSKLKVALESSNSSAVLPSVEMSSSGGKLNELVEIFRKKADGIVLELNQEELVTFSFANYAVDKMKTNVFVFHLHETPSSSPEAVFTRNDEFIGDITGQIAATGLPYSCIFTAVSPSKAVYEKQLSEETSGMVYDRLRRDLAGSDSLGDSHQTAKNGTVFIDGKCILMYFKELTFMFASGSFSVSPHNNTGLKYLVTPECASNSTRRMTFNTSGSGEWNCANTTADVSATLNSTFSVEGKFSFSCDQQPLVPSEYSYHCSKVTLEGSMSKTSLIFSQFQVQPYLVKNGSFSYAYDCVGFFTIPIFMGLLSVGILLLILFIGVLALFSLTTMDRYDDPKGPGIQVASG